MNKAIEQTPGGPDHHGAGDDAGQRVLFDFDRRLPGGVFDDQPQTSIGVRFGQFGELMSDSSWRSAGRGDADGAGDGNGRVA